MTIVSGLALTETALRLSRLLEYRRTVKWDVQPLLCALLGVSTLIINWSNAWHPDNETVTTTVTVGSFVISLSATMLLYLTIATALPSDPDRNTDLGDFYDHQRAVFWGLFTIMLVQFDVRKLIIPGIQGEPIPAWIFVAAAVAVAVSISLIFWRNRVFHGVATVALTVLILGPALPAPF
jgi:hypothetical protein